MVTFDSPFYVKKVGDNEDVIVFDKSPELKTEDSKKGISRFGGEWRTPSYLHSYYRSAEILLQQANLENCLDDVGLPIFYIQRHTTELLTKRLLSWIYEIADFRKELGHEHLEVPSNGQVKRFKKSHDLEKLLKDLSGSVEKCDLKEIPNELCELITTISGFEITETWSRYEKSENRDGQVTNHVEEETVLPLIDLQTSLKSTISSVCYKGGNDESYESIIYYEWLHLARLIGSAG